MPSEHLTASEIAGYLDGDLAAGERRTAEVHLDACPSCRAELTAVGRLAGAWDATPAADDRGRAAKPDARRPRGSWPRAATLGVLAAGLAGVLIARRAPDPIGPPAEAAAPAAVERGTGAAAPVPAASSGGIAAVAPADTVAATSARFVWRPARADVYRLTLHAEDGAPVWTGETTDTTLALPADVPLRPGARYFWRVDGIADGIAVSTGALLLHVRP